MSAAFVLVRHAPTVLQEGVRAAEWRLAGDSRDLTIQLASQLAQLELSAPGGPPGSVGAPELVLTSHEPKATLTGRWLASELGVGSATAKGLEEHHRKRTTLLQEDEWHRTLRRFFANPDVLLFGEETATEARERFAAAIREAQAQRPGKRLALVSHGTVMALLLAAANDLPAYDLWRGLKMPEAFVVDANDLRIRQRLTPPGAR